MNYAFADSIVKKDSDVTVSLIGPGSYEISSHRPSVFIPEPADPSLELEPGFLDDQILFNESKARPARIPVQVLRYVLRAHAGVSALVMTVSYLVYYILSYDESLATPAVITLLASGTLLGVLYALMVLLVVVPQFGGGTASPWTFPLFAGFALALVGLAGSLAALAKTIAPLQAATICFAQCMAVFGYTLESPDGIEPLHAAMYASLAAMVAWFFGLFGYYTQQAWISSGLLLLFGAASSAYLFVQVKQAKRFSVSDTDCKLAMYQFYLDPALALVHCATNRARNV